MILAFCCKGKNPVSGPDAELDERFGRCGYFVFYNSENKSFAAVPNTAGEEAGGAGVKAVQIIVDQGVKVLIAPEVGPQGMAALGTLGIDIFRQGDCKTTGTALQAWLSQELLPLEKIRGLTRVV